MTDPADHHSTTDTTDPGPATWPRRPVPHHTAGWTLDISHLADTARARRQLRAHLADLAPDPDRDDPDPDDVEEATERILLAADEMASNGVRHGGPPVVLGAHTCGPGQVLITVTDHAPGTPPAPDPERDHAHGGLGLLIVAAYARAHGWWPGTGLKTVWALLPTRSQAR
ncbi:ATP-binding protein [Klenkia sp. PcliD-1-E]|uniref:ATP-binding protein n=1 Tax=Klenkia sp. PcliD-1-E TaxID=2954492 RepID=UPI002097012C|nr:ATP-binding protein [Klenkia sp. PcliD-1-E]MCO7220916.1 ATP-binding protein [Klenkia sp. PcliD-1-E]